MTASEFKSWLDGFMDGRKHRPTVKDLDLIAAKAAEIEDVVPFRIDPIPAPCPVSPYPLTPYPVTPCEPFTVGPYTPVPWRMPTFCSMSDMQELIPNHVTYAAH